MNLFTLGDFTMHSGNVGHWKIECDALTDADIECLAFMLAERVGPFSRVEGIPRGGLRIAAAMERYASPYEAFGTPLVVDDVLSTGASFFDWELEHPGVEARGAVLFARGPCPGWVTPLFSMLARVGDVGTTPEREK